ncbi:The BTB (BR-C, ttk and bab)/POZ (Pox virus and Zinc finger) domain [Ceratobasidium sp. AG-Ba]|nr:The BTB (BR-C, ttk and bab)/POZ (Pox virus and Zinc finger) domain [Ceratobasidium sp. AG-Ba]
MMNSSKNVPAHSASTIKVENTLFNVHKYQLMKSEVFSDMFEAAQGDVAQGASPSNPIVVEGVLAQDFESLLALLYAPLVHKNSPALESHYIPAFRLAHKWNFEELKEYTFPFIEQKLDSIGKIIFAREFDLNQLLISGHIELCRRRKPLTGKEAAQLGLQSVLLIWRKGVWNAWVYAAPPTFILADSAIETSPSYIQAANQLAAWMRNLLGRR